MSDNKITPYSRATTRALHSAFVDWIFDESGQEGVSRLQFGSKWLNYQRFVLGIVHHGTLRIQTWIDADTTVWLGLEVLDLGEWVLLFQIESKEAGLTVNEIVAINDYEMTKQLDEILNEASA
jgi:hypothetical protein